MTTINQTYIKSGEKRAKMAAGIKKADSCTTTIISFAYQPDMRKVKGLIAMVFSISSFQNGRLLGFKVAFSKVRESNSDQLKSAGKTANPASVILPCAVSLRTRLRLAGDQMLPLWRGEKRTANFSGSSGLSRLWIQPKHSASSTAWAMVRVCLPDDFL